MSAESALTVPDAVLKHDGRLVAFDFKRLEASIVCAVGDAGADVSLDHASRLGRDVATAVAGAALETGPHSVATAEIRALAIQKLRENGQDAAADAYQNHARHSALLLWRVRVAAPESRTGAASEHPWDRRKLLESLHASGIAPDTAGTAAREVERSVVALRQELISPALIHALAVLALPSNAEGARAYAARRVAFCAAPSLPRFNKAAHENHPLPQAGAALQQFWLQCVHSPEVVDAARGHLLALEPYPYCDTQINFAPDLPLDALSASLVSVFIQDDKSAFQRLNLSLNIDTLERMQALASRLEQLPETTRGTLNLYLKMPARKFFDPIERADAITINAAGLVAREAQRDPRLAAARLAELAALAAQAHREREDYFNRSPVRGRLLPVAIAGLWNAAALLQGEPFQAPRLSRAAFQQVEKMCECVRDTLANLREKCGMDLALTVHVPPLAAQQLWRGDSAFFARDGLHLDADSAYGESFELPLSPALNDFNNRIDFIKQLAALFDEPPAPQLEAPLQNGASATEWAALFKQCADAGVARLALSFGGGARALPAYVQSLRSYLDGFPLLDVLAEGNRF